MSTIAKFGDISASVPSVVGGMGSSIKYFLRPEVNPLNVSLRIPPEEFLLPFGTPIGNRLEAYVSGYAASAGSVTYTVEANTNFNNVGLPPSLVTLVNVSSTPVLEDSPFHIHLVFIVGDIVYGTFESLLNGAFMPERAMTPFRISGLFSLRAGVMFQTSAETNRAALTEFRVVQRGS